mmetsp:Transcript_9435/g.21449  ORF Transcript_9435/g.21449 Transcript_9435/m.21449 type:complete len:233 (-) Transcript_9435:105-803(-)
MYRSEPTATIWSSMTGSILVERQPDAKGSSHAHSSALHSLGGKKPQLAHRGTLAFLGLDRILLGGETEGNVKTRRFPLARLARRRALLRHPHRLRDRPGLQSSLRTLDGLCELPIADALGDARGGEGGEPISAHCVYGRVLQVEELELLAVGVLERTLDQNPRPCGAVSHPSPDNLEGRRLPQPRASYLHPLVLLICPSHVVNEDRVSFSRLHVGVPPLSVKLHLHCMPHLP